MIPMIRMGQMNGQRLQTQGDVRRSLHVGKDPSPIQLPLIKSTSAFQKKTHHKHPTQAKTHNHQLIKATSHTHHLNNCLCHVQIIN